MAAGRIKKPAAIFLLYKCQNNYKQKRIKQKCQNRLTKSYFDSIIKVSKKHKLK